MGAAGLVALGGGLWSWTNTTAPALESPAAEGSLAIAKSILAGFDRHYGLFRYNAQQAKSRFERADWHGAAAALRRFIARAPHHVQALTRLLDVCVDGALDEEHGRRTVNRHGAALAERGLEGDRAMRAPRRASPRAFPPAPWRRRGA